MTKLIQSNPYNNYSEYSDYAMAWAEGFKAGQKSALLPKLLSVTGRWWQAANGKVYFVYQEDYKSYQHAADNYPDRRWLTEETTI